MTARAMAQAGVVLPQRPVRLPMAGAAMPLISYDHATYGTFSTQCIPSIALTRKPDGTDRMWRVEYGRKGTPPGTHAEGAGSYVRISYCDLTQPGGITPANWRKAAYIVPPNETAEVKDTLICEAPDGRLAFFFTIRGNGLFQPLTFLLQNPGDGSDGSWDFTPFSNMYPGVQPAAVQQVFPNKPQWHGSEMRMILSCMRPSLEEDFDPNIHRMIYCRINFYRDTVELEEISTIPAQVNAFATGTWAEACCVPHGRSDLVCTMRTRIGPHIFRSSQSGEPGSWTTPVPDHFPNAIADSKTDLSRSPSGNLIWLHNGAPSSPGRTWMAIGVSQDNLQTMSPVWVFDPRGRTVTGEAELSYPFVIYGRNRDGSYNGTIYAAYDRGRGNKVDAITGEYVAEIIIAEINEASLFTNTRSVTLHTFGLGG